MQREYDKYKPAEDEPADGKFQSTIIKGNQHSLVSVDGSCVKTFLKTESARVFNCCS